MQPIHVRRYGDPAKVGGYSGWIEPEDKSWIMFVRDNGTPEVYLHRDPASGAILPNDPAERARYCAQNGFVNPTSP